MNCSKSLLMARWQQINQSKSEIRIRFFDENTIVDESEFTPVAAAIKNNTNIGKMKGITLTGMTERESFLCQLVLGDENDPDFAIMMLFPFPVGIRIPDFLKKAGSRIAILNAVRTPYLEEGDAIFVGAPQFCISNIPISVNETADELKLKGNALFSGKHYEEALRMYQNALLIDANNASLYSNCSACHLLIGKAALALEDAERGLAIDDSFPRLYYRKAMALKMLERYEDCLKFLKKPRLKAVCIEATDIWNDTTKLQEEIEIVFRESSSGSYPYVLMFSESERGESLDYHAEYFNHEAIEITGNITDNSGYTHGVVAKNHIPAGTLLMASKAVYYNKYGAWFHKDLAKEVAKRLNRKCEDFELFKMLAESVSYEFCINALIDPDDPAQLKQIEEITSLRHKQDSANRGTGFWLRPSFLNYTCVHSNCDRYSIGNFLFIHATRDIETNEQIFLQYYQLHDTFDKRDQMYRRQYKTVCNCKLCILESSESPDQRKKVADILRRREGFNRKDKLPSALLADRSPEYAATVKAGEKLLEDAKAIRPQTDFNPLVVEAEFMLGSLYFRAGKLTDAMRINRKIYAEREKLGWILNLMEVSQTLMTQCVASGLRKDAKYWAGKYKEVAGIFYGDHRIAFMKCPENRPIWAMMNMLEDYQGII